MCCSLFIHIHVYTHQIHTDLDLNIDVAMDMFMCLLIQLFIYSFIHLAGRAQEVVARRKLSPAAFLGRVCRLDEIRLD